MTSTRERGQRGEDAAARHLERHHYAIVDRNVRMRGGEIDIVAREGGDLVFVEVKARRHDAFGTPAEALTPAKATRLARAAAEYLQRYHLASETVRCDVVAVTWPGKEPRIEILRAAIDLGAYRPE